MSIEAVFSIVGILLILGICIGLILEDPYKKGSPNSGDAGGSFGGDAGGDGGGCD